jgi:hypothetical protein
VVKNIPALRIRRYVQGHTLDDDADGEMMRQMYGTEAEGYDGVAEFWWKSRQDLAALAGPEAGESFGFFAQDIEEFTDVSKSPLFVAKEHVIVDKKIMAMPLPVPTTAPADPA